MSGTMNAIGFSGSNNITRTTFTSAGKLKNELQTVIKNASTGKTNEQEVIKDVVTALVKKATDDKGSNLDSFVKSLVKELNKLESNKILGLFGSRSKALSTTDSTGNTALKTAIATAITVLSDSTTRIDTELPKLVTHSHSHTYGLKLIQKEGSLLAKDKTIVQNYSLSKGDIDTMFKGTKFKAEQAKVDTINKQVSSKTKLGSRTDLENFIAKVESTGIDTKLPNFETDHTELAAYIKDTEKSIKADEDWNKSSFNLSAWGTWAQNGINYLNPIPTIDLDY
jgi:hypothetical protein